MIPNGTYASRELISMLEGIIELNQFEIDDQVTKTNKLKGITEITLNLDELIIAIISKMEDPAMNYSLFMWMLMKILHVLNPKPHNIRNLKTESLLP